MIRSDALDLAGWKHADLFWDYTIPEPNTGCWLWMGNIGHWGYGTLKWSGRYLRAHRVAYALGNGPIPADVLVCHRCDVRACCNPSHLFLGTHQDNMDDMAKKGRTSPSFMRSNPGEENPRAKLSEEQVKEIRRLLGIGAKQQGLAVRFGVQKVQISRIKRGTRWRHVL